MSRSTAAAVERLGNAFGVIVVSDRQSIAAAEATSSSAPIWNPL